MKRRTVLALPALAGATALLPPARPDEDFGTESALSISDMDGSELVRVLPDGRVLVRRGGRLCHALTPDFRDHRTFAAAGKVFWDCVTFLRGTVLEAPNLDVEVAYRDQFDPDSPSWRARLPRDGSTPLGADLEGVPDLGACYFWMILSNARPAHMRETRPVCLRFSVEMPDQTERDIRNGVLRANVVSTPEII